MLKINKDYCNVKYFKKIIIMMREYRYEEAICEWHKYIENYPKNLGSYIQCANCYMCIGDFESAEKLLGKVVFSDKSREREKEQYIIYKIKLLCLQEKYSECLNLLNENINIFIKNCFTHTATLLYLKKKLGILKESDYQKDNGKYLFSQIISYDEEAALSHIERHKEFDENDIISKFADNFPLSEIYYKLRNELLKKNKNKIYKDAISDSHVFKYDCNGHVGTKLVDYFLVVTLKDSNDIITMYPYENIERRECIDLTPVVKELPKVKRMSQIDKFNQRYSKK